jgi:ABC-type multidrug transport system ATPase subunit
MDIEKNTLAGIYGSKKKSLISLLSGLENFDGDIVLDSVSLKGDYEEYLSNIAVMTKEAVINTTLTVNDFLDFFGSMSNAMDEGYEERKGQLLSAFNLDNYTNTSMKMLKAQDRKKVKFISLFLKEHTLILLDTILESFQKKELIKIVEFLRSYAKNERIVLIGSDNYQLLKSLNEPIYILN